MEPPPPLLPPTVRNDRNLAGPTLKFENKNGYWKVDIAVTEDGQSKYYADMFEFKSGPDIKMFRGASTDGDLAAVAYFRHLHSPRVGIGGDVNDMQWVKIVRSGPVKRHHTFAWDGRTYIMRSTRDAVFGVRGIKRWWTNLTVTDEAGELVAVYLCTKPTGAKTGFLQFRKETSAELELLTLMSICSWREIARRR